MLHERGRQYERWEKDGELDAHRVKDEWESWKWIALPPGSWRSASAWRSSCSSTSRWPPASRAAELGHRGGATACGAVDDTVGVTPREKASWSTRIIFLHLLVRAPRSRHHAGGTTNKDCLGCHGERASTLPPRGKGSSSRRARRTRGSVPSCSTQLHRLPHRRRLRLRRRPARKSR